MTDEPLDQPLDQLSVLGIECFGHHGVFEHEKREGQRFVVDLTLGLDTRPAGASDRLQDTLDYGSLVQRVKSVVESGSRDLIEAVVQEVAEVCLIDDRVTCPRIKSLRSIFRNQSLPTSKIFFKICGH